MDQSAYTGRVRDNASPCWGPQSKPQGGVQRSFSGMDIAMREAHAVVGFLPLNLMALDIFHGYCAQWHRTMNESI